MKRFLSVGDVGVIILLVFVSILYVFNHYLKSNQQEGIESKAVVITDNEKEELFSLAKDTEVVINSVKIKIFSGKVSVQESSCQNKVCIKTGQISNPGQVIVCVPNRVVIKIIRSNRINFDSLSY